ncbi:hypothetical protein U27_01545 [Candidatus Vecturithrix granuli]|uniref:Uncharacterized protein n=1 Tax=Vecturithrix granuli TaxID=1499967 RepID=A0A081CAN9_VECG1|nr:hypothetical protein U27_01545 [Candidatus Vecturithrix granuli]
MKRFTILFSFKPFQGLFRVSTLAGQKVRVYSSGFQTLPGIIPRFYRRDEKNSYLQS